MTQLNLAYVCYKIATILLLCVIMGRHSLVFAQTSGQWSPDERVPGYLDETFTPYLLADQNRTVHAFASQLVGDPNPQLAIFYRQWRLTSGWTTPIDILLAPGGTEITGALLDEQGIVHVAFVGGGGQTANIYYSYALATEAMRAPAWSPALLVGEGALSPGSGALAGDKRGNLVIIYSGNNTGNGVYALSSTDNGNRWSAPIPIFLTYDSKLVPFSLQMYAGPTGQIHAAWNVIGANGIDISVHYARFDIAHQQWSESVTLEERTEETDFFGPSYPSIVDNGVNVVVMYNSGNPFVDRPVGFGRPIQRVRLSKDQGESWQDPIDPFLHHQGQSGEHTLVVDSNNIVHTLFIQRIDALVDGVYHPIGGIWHSELQGDHWGEPERLIPKISPVDVRGIVSQGNVLLAVWHADPGSEDHGVWYSYKTLNVPELPLTPLPTRLATATATPTPTIAPLTPTPTPQHNSVAVNQTKVKNETAGRQMTFMAFAMLPVVLLIIGVMGIQLYNRRNDNKR